MSADAERVEPRAPERPLLSLPLVALAVLVALAAVFFVLRAVTGRPDNPVEAELIFEAARIARGWPLYVDPAIGASELGAPPSRFLVLYTPVWPFVVGHLGQVAGGAGGASQEVLRLTGRTLATIGWLVVFICPVLAAPARTRRATIVAASLGAGIYFLARNAPTVTPDTVATALVCLAFVRIARQRRVGALAAVLVVVAPFFKPSCLGAAVGLCAALLWPSRRDPTPRLRAVVAATVTLVVVIVFCHEMSGGQWLVHLARSTKQPLTWQRFAQEMFSRVFVLGIPQLAIVIVGIRRGASRLLTWPLLTSIGWATFAMAKHGSGSHYWLEPTALSVVLVAFLPPAKRAAASNERLFLRGIALLLTVLVGVVSVPAYGRELAGWRERRASFASVDAHCPRAPGEIVASSDIGLEMILNDRITVPDWQSSFLARRGVFPVAGWRSDLRDPHVRWLALPFDPELPGRDDNDGRIEVSAYRDLLLDVVREHFVRDGWVGGFLVFRSR